MSLSRCLLKLGEPSLLVSKYSAFRKIWNTLQTHFFTLSMVLNLNIIKFRDIIQGVREFSSLSLKNKIRKIFFLKNPQTRLIFLCNYRKKSVYEEKVISITSLNYFDRIRLVKGCPSFFACHFLPFYKVIKWTFIYLFWFYSFCLILLFEQKSGWVWQYINVIVY